MQNDVKYQVKPREIIELVNDKRSGRLILSPYFQRNLVWRDAHKRDFIDTILHGYPFPQIFLARGPINVETMESSTCVVDGQQRLNAIFSYVEDGFSVNGKKFSELTVKEKEQFLKYDVPVIDFDLDAGSPVLKDVFGRLNRTFYSLSSIERIASEYSASQFLLVARMLSGDITKSTQQIEMELGEDLADTTAISGENEVTNIPNDFLRDPGIDQNLWPWLMAHADGPYSFLMAKKDIFTSYEAQRKVPLMFALNLMCTVMGGYFNRNTKVKEYLERYNNVFPEAEEIIKSLNRVADFISEMDLPSTSMWWNKANFFTLTVELEALEKLPAADKLSSSLLKFEKSLPEDYALAAREAVNNKSQRAARGEFVRVLILDVA